MSGFSNAGYESFATIEEANNALRRQLGHPLPIAVPPITTDVFTGENDEDDAMAPALPTATAEPVSVDDNL